MVNPVYQEFGPAIASVYGTDPATFDWNLYTEGWGRGSAERYDSAGVNQFCAPWLGNMPGWKEVGFWQYENATLDQIGHIGVARRSDSFRELLLGAEELQRLAVYLDADEQPPAESGVRGADREELGGHGRFAGGVSVRRAVAVRLAEAGDDPVRVRAPLQERPGYQWVAGIYRTHRAPVDAPVTA